MSGSVPEPLLGGLLADAERFADDLPCCAALARRADLFRNLLRDFLAKGVQRKRDADGGDDE